MITTQHESHRLTSPVEEPADKHWLQIAAHQMYMAQVERDEPEFFARYEDAHALVFCPDTAMELVMTAPSEYVAGLLMGRYILLKELQAMGR